MVQTIMHTHLLGEVIIHLSGHGNPLVICYNVALEEAHVLHCVAHVGLDAHQDSAVVHPVSGQLLEDESLLICFSLQGIYPHSTGEEDTQVE